MLNSHIDNFKLLNQKEENDFELISQHIERTEYSRISKLKLESKATHYSEIHSWEKLRRVEIRWLKNVAGNVGGYLWQNEAIQKREGEQKTGTECPSMPIWSTTRGETESNNNAYILC